MPFEAGTKLGPYEILESLSVGPEGEVYKASDTTVNRKVMIHVLPPNLSESKELKARLERESRTIASMKHPGISGLVEVGAHDGTPYVVTEDLEGETLTQRLKRGPLELTDALQSAIAIADALDKAHRQGLVHRSLNPSNILLTATGVKLVNFGLATLREESSGVGSESLLATRTSAAPLIAVPGPAAPYLAPEQLEGKPADARTDIFSFGSILYEMVTGKPAFEGKTQALLVASITTVEPDPITKSQPVAPPALDYVVKRCLAKDPRQRLQTAWDLMSQLQWIAEGGTQIGISAPLAAQRRNRDRLFWIAAAASFILAAALGPRALGYFRAAPDPEPARFIASGITTQAPPISVSPDGRWLIVSAGGGVTARGINALLLNSVSPQLLVKDNNVTQAFWSPDSKSIGFFEDGKLKRADIAGGPAKILCDAASPIGSASWGSRDVILFSSNSVLYRVLATGGEPTPVTPVDKTKTATEYVGPSFLPDGNHYLVLALSKKPSESGLYVGSLDSTERTRLLDVDTRAVYAEPGYLVFGRGNTIFAQEFDADKLTLKGEVRRLGDAAILGQRGPNVNPAARRWVNFSVSNTGVLAFRVPSDGTSASSGTTVTQLSLSWLDRSGRQLGQVASAAGYAGVDIAPDGKRFAVHIHEANGGDSWFFDPAQGRMQRLTFETSQDNSNPVWSPDGKRIAFSSLRNNRWGLYVKPADGTGKEQLILESENIKIPTSWSPDGKLLVYQEGTGQGYDIWDVAVDVEGTHKPVALAQTPANERQAQVSPDGKWLAYESNETGRAEIYIKPFPEGPGKWQVSTEGGNWPRWRGDSKELLFSHAPDIAAIEIRVSGGSIQAGVPQALFPINNPNLVSGHPVDYLRYAVTPDGQRLLIPQQTVAGVPQEGARGARGARGATGGGLAELMITAADTDTATSTAAGANSVTVVLNWPSLLKASKDKR